MAKANKPTTQKKPTPQKKVLGRGFSALISPEDATTPLTHIGPILLEHIEVNPTQPRVHFDEGALAALAQSIKVHGIIQPLTVRELSKDKYQLISGQRRYMAAKIVGLREVPAFLRKATSDEVLEMALIENIQRESLNAIEIACTYQRLIEECDLKQEEVARRVGKERATVTNYVRLLQLPDKVQVAVRDKSISMGHARALAGLDHADQQLLAMEQVLDHELSVRATEALVQRLSSKKPKKSIRAASSAGSNAAFLAVEKTLTAALGTKVAIKPSGNNHGQICISFYSVEDLNRLIEEIQSTS